MAEHKTLAQKIAEVSASAKVIRPTGRGDGYRFLTIQDVIKAVRKQMQSRNLVMSATVRTIEHIPDGRGLLASVVVDWTLTDTETGQNIHCVVPGDGWGEKGVYKALTGSRKYAIIFLFDLAIGDNPEAGPAVDRKESAKAVGAQKVAEFAGAGNDTAIEAMSQVVPEKKLTVSRPDEYNGHWIILRGYVVPQLEQFLDANGGKRTKKKDEAPYWKISSDHEKGLVKLCQLLEIEVG